MAKTFEDLLRVLTVEGFEVVTVFEGAGVYNILGGDAQDTRPVAQLRDRAVVAGRAERRPTRPLTARRPPARVLPGGARSEWQVRAGSSVPARRLPDWAVIARRVTGHAAQARRGVFGVRR